MNEDYERELSLINAAYQAKALDEANYTRILNMLLDSDGECLIRLIEIIDEIIEALADCKRQKISERLVIGAEKIEATEDPKERARLMVHYNNLLKELTA